MRALPLPLIALVAWRFAHRVMPISRAVQQRKADVTESANEAVVGIEMVQAFGRERDVRDRFAERAGAVRSKVLRQARVESQHLPGLFYLPSLSIVVVLYFGGQQVIDGSLSYGQFALFIQLLLQLVWPLESMGWIINLGQRALASAGRTFAWIETVPTLEDPPHPRRCRTASRSASNCATCTSPIPAAPAVLRGVDLCVEPGEVVADLRRDRRGQVLAARARAPLLRPHRRGRAARRPRRRGRCGSPRPRRHRAGHPAADPVLESLRENLTADRPDAPGRRSRRRATSPASPRSSPSCPTAGTRRSASAA